MSADLLIAADQQFADYNFSEAFKLYRSLAESKKNNVEDRGMSYVMMAQCVTCEPPIDPENEDGLKYLKLAAELDPKNPHLRVLGITNFGEGLPNHTDLGFFLESLRVIVNSPSELHDYEKQDVYRGLQRNKDKVPAWAESLVRQIERSAKS